MRWWPLKVNIDGPGGTLPEFEWETSTLGDNTIPCWQRLKNAGLPGAEDPAKRPARGGDGSAQRFSGLYNSHPASRHTRLHAAQSVGRSPLRSLS